MDNIETKLQLCESRIAYTFSNKLLLCEALQTSGYGIFWQDVYTSVPKNTRLAVYGDTALNMALCSLWYPKGLSKGLMTSFPTILRMLICAGEWTQIRNVASNSNLAAVGLAHSLDTCVILNPGTQAVSHASLATTVEAILGAVQLDGGSDALLQVATRLGLVPQMIIPVMSRIYSLPPYLNKNHLHLT